MPCKTKAEARRYSGKWPLLLAAGFAFAGDLAFWHTSIKLTSVANSTLLANLASIFVTLAAWIFLRQRPSGLFLAGLAAALAGVALLVHTSLGFSSTGLAGDALGVVTAMFYAGYILAVKGLRDRGETTLHLMAVTSTITALFLLPVALASGEQMLPVSAFGWWMLVGLALISHAAGQGLIAYALAHLPAAFSSVSLLFQPVMAALFAWVLLAEGAGAAADRSAASSCSPASTLRAAARARRMIPTVRRRPWRPRRGRRRRSKRQEARQKPLRNRSAKAPVKQHRTEGHQRRHRRPQRKPAPKAAKPAKPLSQHRRRASASAW